VLIQEGDGVFGVVEPARGSALPVDPFDFAVLQGLGLLSVAFELNEHMSANRGNE
jgi:hypothetical protein